MLDEIKVILSPAGAWRLAEFGITELLMYFYKNQNVIGNQQNFMKGTDIFFYRYMMNIMFMGGGGGHCF